MNNDPGYTGAYRDAVTGGYPLGNGYRVYLPSLMRFCVPDDLSPFGKGGIHPYAYCQADPINRSDPSGHISVEAFAGTLAAKATVDALREASGVLAGNDERTALADALHGMTLIDDRPSSSLQGTGAALRERTESRGPVYEPVFSAPRIVVPETTDTLAASRVAIAHVDGAKTISMADREHPFPDPSRHGGSRRARAYLYDSDEEFDDVYSPGVVDSRVDFIKTMWESVDRRLATLRRKVASNYRVLGVTSRLSEEQTIDADFELVRARSAALNLRSEIGIVIDHPAFHSRREELKEMQQSVGWLL